MLGREKEVKLILQRSEPKGIMRWKWNWRTPKMSYVEALMGDTGISKDSSCRHVWELQKIVQWN